MNELERLEIEYNDIVRNELKSDSRVVFGEGKEHAQILLIGEAPGENEEKQGKPFVGAAGKNLMEFLDILELTREDIYITNVVKIRPYKISEKTGKRINRTPNKIEFDASVPILKRQIEYIHPRIVVTLGNTALRAVYFDNKITIGDVHGRPIDMEGYTLFPLYHPASIIYNRALKDTYIDDVKRLKSYMNNM